MIKINALHLVIVQCQSPSGDSCGNCKNTSGNKEGSGGTFSKRCMFGMLEFLGIAAAIFGIMSLGLGYLGNKAIKEAGTNDMAKDQYPRQTVNR